MEYNNYQTKLADYISFYERNQTTSIKWDKYNQLESVYKNNAMLEELKARAGYLHKWMCDIGKEVYSHSKRFNYTLASDFDNLDWVNQRGFDTTKSITFTQEVFDRFCFDYLEYQVKRFTEELTERSITSNSTSKISNLVFEWNLECKQELLKIFKSIIE